MDQKSLKELSEVIQSSNINFLLGAGVSCPFLPILGAIETSLNATSDKAEKEKLYKQYLKDVMLPNKGIVDRDKTTLAKTEYLETVKAYKNFFLLLSDILLKRKSTILSKQINLFTTNIDILIETILEELHIEFSDGFSGKFSPEFSLANYKKSIHQRSLHFEHTSEIPVFNVLKIHGSLTWKNNEAKDKIIFSRALEHFSEELHSKVDEDFVSGYSKILVVNPEETKHLVSVLNIYYSELLRMYSSELEKENATLFIIGFSMEDKHIKEITLRAAKSNPTLRIYLCCSQARKETMSARMEVGLHPNIHICVPEKDNEKFTLECLNENILNKLLEPKAV